MVGTRQKLDPVKSRFQRLQHDGKRHRPVILRLSRFATGARRGHAAAADHHCFGFFLANTVPVAVIISLTEGKSAHKVWAECHFWSFPFYMVGAAVVFAVGFISKQVGWQTSLLVLPLVYWVYRSYHLYLAKLATEKKQVEIEKRNAEDVASAALAHHRVSGTRH